MPKNEMTREPIPENFTTLEDFDDFWSKHSLADYDDLLTDVEFNVALDDEVIAIAPALVKQLRKRARMQGVSIEALVNTLLSDKLQEAA